MFLPLPSLRVSCIAIGFLVVSAAPHALAWGCDGHKTVAYLAFERLNSHARTAVIELLNHLPPERGLSHYCPADTNRFVEVSTWADDIRVQKPATGPWHFIDLALGTTMVDPKYCPFPPGCVITAIQNDVATLRDLNASAGDRAVALLFLIHFVGDLHQPLHDTTNNDRGANCLPVSFFGQQPQELANENFKPNLHAVWDTDLVEKAKAGRSIADFAAYLDAKYPSSINVWIRRPPNIFNWVLESHRLASSVVYGRLPVPVALEPPIPINACSDDNHVSRRLAALHEVIDNRYFTATHEVLEVQLVRAGVRLSVILNRIWQ
jgi:S1/P1 Nuclease